MFVEFTFPLPRVHTGVHLANGRMGALVWGDQDLHLTIAQNGFWDRRGAREFATPMPYQDLKSKLLGGQELAVRAAFAEDGRPYQIGGGRFVLSFDGASPKSAQLNLETGELVVFLSDESTVRIVMSMERNRLEVEMTPALQARCAIQLLPSWKWTGKELEAKGVEAPEEWQSGRAQGFIQRLPADSALSVVGGWEGQIYLIGTELGEFDPASAEAGLDRLRVRVPSDDPGTWWQPYWARVKMVKDVPADLREAYTYAIWKLGCLTHPGGVAATLQGPWMEEHRIPLWSNDYHFNINLQMIYWPCLHLGLHDHLRPLWQMVEAWRPQLQRNGEFFFGRETAAMLPHAVDDQCHPIGSYWQGTIDHASTAWIALMAWLDYQGSQDRWVLETIAWPLLVGAFEGFRAMMEDSGDALSLPITVSPEFGEGAIGTWGRNASFQLAAVHMLCQHLPAAAAAMGQLEDPQWADTAKRLPRYSLAPVPRSVWDDPEAPDRFRIALWEGLDLPESHRHHSHLAGIYPFESLGSEDGPVIEKSVAHWSTLGAGQWCAWGLAWAVCIMAKVGWKTGAETWLRFLIGATANEGKSLSAGGAHGCFISWGSADDARRHAHEGDFEVMQLDANMGLITAVHELYGKA